LTESLFFEVFFAGSLWARCASHFKDLSIIFVQDMMSTPLIICASLWAIETAANEMALVLEYYMLILVSGFTVRYLTAFHPSIRDQLRFIRIFG
jgi:hypothetical protein